MAKNQSALLVPGLTEFERLARAGFNRIPVCREILADLETPVSAFLKLAGESAYAFLLESVVGGEKWGRYSFLGTEPAMIWRARENRVERFRPGSVTETREVADPFEALREEVKRCRAPELPGLPRFFGGALGFVSYDMVRYFERLSSPPPDHLQVPDAYMIFTDVVVAFDNLRQKLSVIATVVPDEFDSIDRAYASAAARIDSTIARLRSPAPLPRLRQRPPSEEDDDIGLTSNHTRESYHRVVAKAKDYIAAGDVIQVVPSQRFEAPLTVHPFNLYRSLRGINPSPYMFYLRLGDHVLVGASPEIMVRVEGRRVTVRPIAGTRKRGATEQEDLELERELLADPKERAEHIMLVDLGRNDVGRVAKIGSVKVTEFMTVERYSHVMHIVSNVTAELADHCDAFDAFRATFPAGTVSGAPKIRAMEIIDELEPTRRGVYAGAVGYFSYTGNADTAIALRTMLIKNNRVYIQAGGGVVADSDPEAEYQETINKAMAMRKALEAARELERLGRGE